MPEIVEFEDGSTPKPPINLPATIREVEKDSFVETFTVHDHGKKYEVAANAVANRAMMQINVAKLRTLCDRTIDSIGERVLEPKELKQIVEAVAMVEDMSGVAYGDTKKNGGGKLGNALERLAHGMTRAAIEAGAKNHGSHSAEARLSRLLKIGKNKQSEIIDVPETK